jgi:NADH:ubiquinone oxidoreductase subunit
MGLLKQIFTWWDGATIGTSLFTRRFGQRVGSDSLGNVYFQSKKDGARRWVIYSGSNDASVVPPDWFSWLHRQIDGLPDEALPPVRAFQKPATGNSTGTAGAFRPAGALERGGQRAAATGDYQAWTPD